MTKRGSSLRINADPSGTLGQRTTVWRLAPLGLAAGLMLAGCAEREVQLVGEREDLRSVFSEQVPGDIPQVPVNQALPIALPAQSSNAAWTQGSGTPSTRTAHPALGAAPQLLWQADIGQGDGRKVRITSDPVVAEGRIFTVDATGHVTATAASGATLWQANLVPAQDREGEASGGGIAYGAGRVFVTTGFGELTALDAETGAELWQQKLLAPATGAPTIYAGLVYVTAGEAQAWALDAETGRVRWQLSATPDVNNFAGAPSPALTDQYALFGFGSGEVQAAFRQGGMGVWSTLVTGRRQGFARANVNDITGDPVVVGNRVYTGNQSGRMVALALSTGERLWTADEGPMGPAWVAGGSAFIVTDRNQLVRLDADTGARIWGVDLPYFQKSKPRKQEAVYAHYGPVLAGGRLVVASSDGLLRFFDPVSGALTHSAELPAGAASAPVVAGGVLYVLNKKGQLLAYR
ncbi:Outer membrane protein assembly factor BamB, contains PQQ-like beta-propeller repeat [Pseudooceanicola antarcticus]|uniref:Outer membrane protein assembly factor BamB, contains PQQ-like beta-propeller repeat n=2 Tax=Pseudooceanicola antarcticus TaxID=1247613 RepID=A0A285J8Y2_9RHOB|nr:Outer membrane protein assembly factor BamB, contains PQQ-like beta-propeller repeat [Pseudooceanicola antarcticus]